jgi:hypothetical protein
MHPVTRRVAIHPALARSIDAQRPASAEPSPRHRFSQPRAQLRRADIRAGDGSRHPLPSSTQSESHTAERRCAEQRDGSEPEVTG